MGYVVLCCTGEVKGEEWRYIGFDTAAERWRRAEAGQRRGEIVCVKGSICVQI